MAPTGSPPMVGKHAPAQTLAQASSNKTVNSVASVAEGVSSFLNGIKVSFRHENVNVSASVLPSLPSTNHDGK